MRFLTRTLRPDHCDPLYLLRELGTGHEYCALLESADRSHFKNDFSFLALGARDVIEVTGSDPLKPFERLSGACFDRAQHDTTHDRVERLRMGYIGYLSYEAARHFDRIELEPDPDVPDAVFFLPEVLLRIDHRRREVTIIAHEDTEEDLGAIAEVVNRSPFWDDAPDNIEKLGKLPLASLEDIEPYRKTSREEFCESVNATQEGILAGETFQVVLSQELLMQEDADPTEVYGQLRSINPSPYMYYWRTPSRTIVGASPETLLRIEGRNMLYRPIAGTRKRTGDPKIDQKMREELHSDEKERCEHQMLVDLGRNDVGRVAEIGSVQVRDPFHIEQYAHVYHIVSDITATLREDLSPLDAVRAVFPAGTLTGAPKIRAMEVIRSLEGRPRGIYGGAFGYVDLTGNVDLAITIRTMLFDDRGISLRVGAGIVKDSVPDREDNECLHKARSCLAAVMHTRRARMRVVSSHASKSPVCRRGSSS